jgi:hypothetical protein
MVKKTKKQIQAILDKIEFTPFGNPDNSYFFRLLEKGDGFLLQVIYYDQDVDAPKIPVSGGCHAGPKKVLQHGRKFYVSPFMTETEVVETAWLACTRSMMHVAGEYFNYDGQRVYSPHFQINLRKVAAYNQLFDKRPKAKK